MKRFALLSLLVAGVGCGSDRTVGSPSETGVLVPTGQEIKPAGTTIRVAGGRPMELAISKDGQFVFVKDSRGLLIVDPISNKIEQTLPSEGGTSFTGLQVSADGSVWLTSAGKHLRQAKAQKGVWSWANHIELPAPKVGGAPYPCGFALQGQRAWVVASRSNALLEVDLATKKVLRSIAVDVAPYDVVLVAGKAYVSCWGGEPPEAADRKQDSSGTPVKVDRRGVAAGASILEIDLAKGTPMRRFKVGLQPTKIAVSGTRLFVACANADRVADINLKAGQVREWNTRFDEKLPFGSAPNGLLATRDRLYVSNGGTNDVAVFSLAGKKLGHIPAGWYPMGLALSKGELWVANAKGIGSREGTEKGFNVYQFTGGIQRLKEPSQGDLDGWQDQVKANGRSREALAALERGDGKAAPVPIPEPGQPSVIEHVVYILKENRTYDQVFGDLPQGDGEPKFCLYPREVTPNHHALAEEFGLLDNFYCNGVLSADGHAWAMEGNATTHFERSFGGWTRSYPFGDDPLAVSSTGFIWDAVLGAGLSFRNFGEFDYAEPIPASATYKEIYDDFVSGAGKIKFTQKIGVDRLRDYSSPSTPGWNMRIPDVLRADRFIREIATMPKLPNLTILFLPQDHTSGTSAGEPTPNACLADNDLALGRAVEALSKRPEWAKMAIFVTEDDPQAGFDHVDGHRTVAMAISPYSKRGKVVTKFYNQTSMLHTMCRILGIAPLNYMVAQSPVMSDCFQTTPDLRPYTALKNNVPLDELNPSKGETAQAEWARKTSASLDLSVPDRIEDDTLNRILWIAKFGQLPYPAEWAGAHGKGLAKRGLKATDLDQDDD